MALWKGTAMETVKRWMTAKVLKLGKTWICGGQWIFMTETSVWHCDGECMSLTLSKSIKYTTQKVGSSINYWTLVNNSVISVVSSIKQIYHISAGC